MFKNNKRHILNLIYFIYFSIFISSCKEKKVQYNNQSPITVETKLNDTVYIKNKNLINDSVYIQGENLIIDTNDKKIIYKNLIVNYASLNTTLEPDNHNIFYLIYEYNASLTKMQHIYKYYYKDSLMLIFKEINKLHQGKFTSNRIYFNNKVIDKQTYDDLEPILENIKSSYMSSKKNAVTLLYDSNFQVFGKIIDSLSGLEKYIDVINNVKRPLFDKELHINNIEKANNTAFYLEQMGLFKESIVLLNKITKISPNRTVAYINLGDAYWGLNKKDKAKAAYKIYIKQMKANGKANKIPNRVLIRIKD